MTDTNPFRPARRAQARLRLALSGPSNSGKTHSALLLAKGLNDRVAVIDTERNSASLYADVATFDTLALDPPFTPQRYIDAVKAAEAHGYGTVIIDSLSHAWAGEGGVLALHDRAMRNDSRANSFSAWRDVTPKHNALVDAILGSRCHIIATMRTKVAYDVVQDERGKSKPVKIGLAPIQREGMEYEFTTVLDLDAHSHCAIASKDRTRLFAAGEPVLLDVSHGAALLAWLNAGVDVRGELRAQLEAAAAGGPDELRDAARAAWRSANGPERAILQELHSELMARIAPGAEVPVHAEPESTAAPSLEEAAAARAKRLRGLASGVTP
jgi:hypothetical protein